MMKINPYLLLMYSLLLLLLYIYLSLNIHPLNMIILLIIYSMIICMIMSIWTYNFIYSIMIFLIMISGMLIIFLYFSSLIPNIKINYHLNFLMLMNFFINLLIFIYFMKTSNIWNFNFYLNMDLSYTYLMNTSLYHNIKPIYSPPSSNITLLSILYLLLSLFMIIKMCSTKHLTLRKLQK